MINNTVRTAARTGAAKRAISSTAARSEPKMHKAAVFKQLEASRPVDPHPHPVFEPPYNKVVVAGAIIGVVTSGYGAMYFGMRHQQYKQGYWK
mmetsp:Transcript_18138/g.24957  ORF Transcript_18138/g.24957 Transcript_18138/m.24957 type:complete len:93 (-) Transcript_18138:279-557(-)